MHQKQHWAQHKRLCKAIQDVLKDDWERFNTILGQDHLKLGLMNEVIEKKGCSLELYESQMFFYPKECAICYDRNVESLVDCRNCALSFCKSHEDDNAHKDACAPLELCLRTSLLDMDHESILNMCLQHSLETTFTFLNMTNMKDFINSYGNIEGHSETSYDILAANLSEYLTRPLTLLHAMKVLNYIPKSKELVIHIVAASDIEEYTLKMWETLLHLIIKTESLVIVIIRSGLNNESPSLSVCDNCLSQGKKISLKFHDGLYEDYVHSSSFLKPDFAVGFNRDIQKDDTYLAEITMLSIKRLAEQNCPFVITNHTQDELEKSINRINTILSSKVDRVYSGKNPFTSLRPHRSIKRRELVFYLNNFVAIYRSLCS